MKMFPCSLATRPDNGCWYFLVGTSPPWELGKHSSLEPHPSPPLPLFLTPVVFPKCCGLMLGANSSHQQDARESSATDDQPSVVPLPPAASFPPGPFVWADSPFFLSPQLLLVVFSSHTCPPCLTTSAFHFAFAKIPEWYIAVGPHHCCCSAGGFKCCESSGCRLVHLGPVGLAGKGVPALLALLQ